MTGTTGFLVGDFFFHKDNDNVKQVIVSILQIEDLC